MSSSTADSTQEETPQEILNKLEKTYLEKAKLLNEAKEQLDKARDVVIAASNESFRAFVTLTNTKEQYLVNVINAQQQELKKQPDATSAISSTGSSTKLPTAASKTPAAQPAAQPAAKPKTYVPLPSTKSKIEVVEETAREDNLDE